MKKKLKPHALTIEKGFLDTIIRLGLLCFLAIASSTANAGLIFSFSFSNTIGNVPGTVEGRIFGLMDNANNQAAASVIIDSYPAALGLFNPIDATLWNSPVINSFDVLNGAIVPQLGDGFAAQNIGANFYTLLLGEAASYTDALGTVTNNALGSSAGTSGNFDFANGIVYTNITDSEVPSPATIALFGLGLAGIGWTRRKKA